MKTDVLILHSQEGGEIPKDKRPGLETFLKRGGGVVVIHAANVPQNNSADGSAYLKSIIGGSWVWGKTKWLEGPMSLYYVDRTVAEPETEGDAVAPTKRASFVILTTAARRRHPECSGLIVHAWTF